MPSSTKALVAVLALGGSALAFAPSAGVRPIGFAVVVGATVIVLAWIRPWFACLTAAKRAAELGAARFEAAANGSFDAHYLLDAVRDSAGTIVDFRFVFINAEGERTTTLSSSDVLGNLLCEMLPIHRTCGLFDAYVRVVESGEPYDDELAFPTGEADPYTLHVHAVRLADGISVVSRNTTHERAGERRLREANALRGAMLDSASCIIFAVSDDGTMRSLNRFGEDLLGLSEADVVGTSCVSLVDPIELAERATPGETALATLLRYDAERPLHERRWTLRTSAGEPLAVDLTWTPLTTESETGWLAIANDVRERIAATERIRFLAMHDPLTGLANRRMFAEHVEAALARRDAAERGATLLVGDLDRFKAINDRLGHDAGDRLLCAVAERLQASLRKSDMVARFGGDEFVILLDGAVEPHALDHLTETLAEAVAAPFAVDGYVLRPAISFGTGNYPRDAGDLTSLLRHADRAMYAAKNDGRARHARFAGVPDTEPTRREAVEGLVS